MELDQRDAQLVGNIEELQHVALVGPVDCADNAGIEAALGKFSGCFESLLEGRGSTNGVMRCGIPTIEADLHIREVRWFELPELAESGRLGVGCGDDMFVADLLGRPD